MTDLQAQNNSPRPQPLPRPTTQPAHADDGDDLDDEDEDEDMDDDDDKNNEGSSTPAAAAALEHSASMVSLPSLSQITTSPSIFGAGAGRHYSISSASQASYSPYFRSTQTSPAFGPQLHHVSTAPAYGGGSNSASGLGSPALRPIDQLRNIAEGATELSDKQRLAPKPGRGSDHDLDHEATAALLMLNNDRRQWRAAAQITPDDRRGNGGMSVRDLLSG